MSLSGSAALAATIRANRYIVAAIHTGARAKRHFAHRIIKISDNWVQSRKFSQIECASKKRGFYLRRKFFIVILNVSEVSLRFIN